jgi:DNA-binding GntR family transcriptional regulator
MASQNTDGASLAEPYVLPGTRASVITGELRRLIQAGEFPPGTRLRQGEIAARFGASTTPVREAFHSLAREGLVRIDPHRGAMVFAPDLADLHENYELRGVLEPLATRIAASQIDRGSLDGLSALIAEMRREKDQGRYQDLNREFHRLIYAAANRPQLSAYIEQLRDAAEAYLRREGTTQNPGHMKQLHKEHEAILAALEEHDGSAAELLMADHLEHNRQQLSKLVDAS